MTGPTTDLDFYRRDVDTMRAEMDAFVRVMQRRRSVRDFAPDPIPLDVVRAAVVAAGTAPSGAHMQPWTFALVTGIGRDIVVDKLGAGAMGVVYDELAAEVAA